MSYLFQMENNNLIEAFLRFPPEGFQACPLHGDGWTLPAFAADYDLLTTADETVRRRVLQAARLLPAAWKNRLLTPRTLFVGTTVSEFAPFPAQSIGENLPRLLTEKMAGVGASLLIVKDLAPTGSFFAPRENLAAEKIRELFTNAGFTLLDGQALAYVPIDFPDVDDFLARFSRNRRADFRRKLKSSCDTQLSIIPTGDPLFADARVVDSFYRLYNNAYEKSATQFDKLPRPFFHATLTDGSSGGLVFTYRRRDELIGWFLCLPHGGFLVDKYMGIQDPQFRDNNLYFISWFDILRYARRNGFHTAVFGWTTPLTKAYLGASFLYTTHAVYIPNPLLRRILTPLAGAFESDRKILADWYANRKKR